MDKDLCNETSPREFKKQFGPATYQLCWTEDAAAIHAQDNSTIDFN